MKLLNLYSLKFYQNSRNFCNQNFYLSFFSSSRFQNSFLSYVFENARSFLNFNLYQVHKKEFFLFFFCSNQFILNLKSYLISTFLFFSFSFFAVTGHALILLARFFTRCSSFFKDKLAFFCVNNRLCFFNKNINYFEYSFFFSKLYLIVYFQFFLIYYFLHFKSFVL